MKRSALVILWLLTAFCVSAAPTAKKKKPAAKSNEITSVMMYRTVCYGRCPEYSIEINKDGMATYTGMRFAPDTGIFKKSIGKAKAKEIINMFIANRADTCREMYENRIPDVPGLTITIKYPKKTKKIFSANFGPGFLLEIAEAMDAAAKKTDKKGWKKTGMPKFE